MRAAVRLVALVIMAFSTPGPARSAEPQGAFAFGFTAIEGQPLPLARYAGHPLLVVNTASMCGYTYQYEALQALWQRYRDRGLVVLGVPSNDFRQERGSAEEIKTFCEANFAVDFPITEKVAVTGAGSHPLFAWFRQQLGDDAGPSWNFNKYLVGPDGKVIASWDSGVEPGGAQITRAIEGLLPTS